MGNLREGGTTMVDRYFVNIEPVEPTGVVLTIEGLPRLLVFGRTREEALRQARHAITFHMLAAAQAGEAPHGSQESHDNRDRPWRREGDFEVASL
jgi:predicted RNase H-like HicB family nuclease